jgi:hypothetical protein
MSVRRNDDVIVRMGRWCCGHHERSREVGKEGGWIIMKKQAPQDAISSTCGLRSGVRTSSGGGWWLFKGRCSRCMMVGGEWEGQEEKYLNLLLKLEDRSRKGGDGTIFGWGELW